MSLGGFFAGIWEWLFGGDAGVGNAVAAVVAPAQPPPPPPECVLTVCIDPYQLTMTRHHASPLFDAGFVGWLGDRGEIATALKITGLLQKHRRHTVKALIVFTEFLCINDDDARVRLGDVVVMIDAVPSSLVKSVVARCMARDGLFEHAESMAECMNGEDCHKPTDVQDYRQAAGDRKGPAVHCIPGSDTKTVEDFHRSGTHASLSQLVEAPVIIVGGVMDYRNQCPDYNQKFRGWANVNGGLVWNALVRAFDAGIEEKVAWPPQQAAESENKEAEVKTATSSETKGDDKCVSAVRETVVRDALRRLQKNAVAEALRQRQLEQRKADHAATMAGRKRKLEQLGKELDAARAKVRKIEADVAAAREQLARLEVTEIV